MVHVCVEWVGSVHCVCIWCAYEVYGMCMYGGCICVMCVYMYGLYMHVYMIYEYEHIYMLYMCDYVYVF